MFLDIALRRLDGNSDLLGCDGNTSSSDRMGENFGNDELCHHYPK